MPEHTMKAVQITEYGGPEVLQVVEILRPQPRAAQVLVQVYASGINPADWKMRAGLFRPFRQLHMPWIPGLEGAGVVAGLGPGVSQFQVGQAVFGLISGSYAEYAVADAAGLQPKLDNLSFEEAATIPVGALTAWGAVVDTAKVQKGQRVLVHGAVGGVGLYAVQLVRWLGAYAIGTTSTGNVGLAQELGAEQVIDYTQARFETLLHDLDVVINTVGGELLESSLQVLRPGGVYVTVARSSDPNAGQGRQVRVENAGQAPKSNLPQITRLVEAGHLRPVVGKVFPLEEARQAQELSETGHGRGRIILRIKT